MRTAFAAAAALVAALAGCVNVKVEVPSPGGSPGQGQPSQLPAGSWQSAQGVMGAVLGAEQGLLFYAFDTLAYPGRPVDLTAKLTTPTLDPLPGAAIAFYDDRSQLVGSAATDSGGTATIAWTPPRAGYYRFTARIVSLPEPIGQGKDTKAFMPAPLLVAARPADTRFVVIDLDHTVVDGSFWRVLMGGAQPAEDSVRVTNRIARKYTLIYLTNRPDLLTRKSKEWLTQHGYPPGPLLVSDVRGAMTGGGGFKTGKLAEIIKAYPNVEIGIGDKLSDARAYADNGLVAYLLPQYDRDDAKDLRKIAQQLSSLGGKTQVVTDWRQIEAGIFDGRKYPPGALADSLTHQADQLDAQRKAKKQHREKDDD